MDFAESYLRKVNELCESLSKPLVPADVKKVREIYDEITYNGPYGLKPLSCASYLGFQSIVDAFIQCAKQTSTNLDTGETGDGEFQKFLWLSNTYCKTALDVAIEKNHVEIAKLLLKNASLECLISDRNDLGQLPVSMLSDPQHDKFIFDILEVARRKEVYPPTTSIVLSVDDHRQQGSLVYNETTMSPLSYPRYHKNSHTSGTALCIRSLDSGLIEVTPNKNTILHLVSEWGDVDSVKEILQNHTCLLYRRNSRGETPAFVAAREGHVDILAIMIYYFKKEFLLQGVEQFVTRDKDKHTALHIAIQNHHVGVVFWLIHEIPQLINCVNDFGEIPHFLAAERGFDHILQKVFPKCNQRDFTTPSGKTTLHAAAIYGSPGCIETVLNHSKDLLYRQDKRGWTPLFYSIYHNNISATAALLNADCSIGCQMLVEDDISTSPIYFSAIQGHFETMKVLISKCPGCLEITYGNGRNILHFAIENKKLEVIRFMFSCELFTGLINESDDDGNTPIHLFMRSNDIEIEMMQVIMDSRVNMNALNNEYRTPLDVASSDGKRERLLKDIGNVRGIRNQTRNLFPKVDMINSNLEEEGLRILGERLEEVEKIVEKKVEEEEGEVAKVKKHEEEFEPHFKEVANLVVVTTLVATATFAAAFTVPGGFDGNEGSKNQGMPILLKKAAYKAFVVTNAIAFSCSCCVLSGYIWMLIYRMRIRYHGIDESDFEKIRQRTNAIYFLTGVALITMAIAFVTGMYVVLTPSLGFAITMIVMSLFIMVLMSLFSRKMNNLILFLYEKVMWF